MKKLATRILLLLSLQACREEEKTLPAPGGNVELEFIYEADGQKLTAAISYYPHPAGYTYSVTTLQYFISGITLYSQQGQRQSDGVFYSDISFPYSNKILLTNILPGEYSGISFCIGVDSIHNIGGMLDSSANAQKMQWPGSLGGGYHFLKLEGYYQDSAGKHAYAMHLGKNPNLVKTHLIPLHKTVGSGETLKIQLGMNLSEWYRSPFIYDFNADGNYIMGNDAAMKKLSMNGSDLFTLKE